MLPIRYIYCTINFFLILANITILSIVSIQLLLVSACHSIGSNFEDGILAAFLLFGSLKISAPC